MPLYLVIGKAVLGCQWFLLKEPKCRVYKVARSLTGWKGSWGPCYIEGIDAVLMGDRVDGVLSVKSFIVVKYLFFLGGYQNQLPAPKPDQYRTPSYRLPKPAGTGSLLLPLK